MATMFDSIIQFFDDIKWTVVPSPHQNIIEITYKGKSGSWNCIARIREDQDQFLFYSLLPDNVPKASRENIAILITWINYGLLIGNFEMDTEDGELRFKTYVDVGGTQLTHNLIKSVVYKNVLAMDRYLPLINAGIEKPDAMDDLRQQIVERNKG